MGFPFLSLLRYSLCVILCSFLLCPSLSASSYTDGGIIDPVCLKGFFCTPSSNISFHWCCPQGSQNHWECNYASQADNLQRSKAPNNCADFTQCGCWVADPGLSDAAIAGIAVGASFGGIIVFVILIVLLTVYWDKCFGDYDALCCDFGECCDCFCGALCCECDKCSLKCCTCKCCTSCCGDCDCECECLSCCDSSSSSKSQSSPVHTVVLEMNAPSGPSGSDSAYTVKTGGASIDKPKQYGVEDVNSPPFSDSRKSSASKSSKSQKSVEKGIPSENPLGDPSKCPTCQSTDIAKGTLSNVMGTHCNQCGSDWNSG